MYALATARAHTHAPVDSRAFHSASSSGPANTGPERERERERRESESRVRVKERERNGTHAVRPRAQWRRLAACRSHLCQRFGVVEREALCIEELGGDVGQQVRELGPRGQVRRRQRQAQRSRCARAGEGVPVGRMRAQAGGLTQGRECVRHGKPMPLTHRGTHTPHDDAHHRWPLATREHTARNGPKVNAAPKD